MLQANKVFSLLAYCVVVFTVCLFYFFIYATNYARALNACLLIHQY